MTCNAPATVSKSRRAGNSACSQSMDRRLNIMESKKSNEREFYNVRVRAAAYKTISDFAFQEHLNLARCVEEALEDYIKKIGMEVSR